MYYLYAVGGTTPLASNTTGIFTGLTAGDYTCTIEVLNFLPIFNTS